MSAYICMHIHGAAREVQEEKIICKIVDSCLVLSIVRLYYTIRYPFATVHIIYYVVATKEITSCAYRIVSRDTTL